MHHCTTSPPSWERSPCPHCGADTIPCECPNRDPFGLGFIEGPKRHDRVQFGVDGLAYSHAGGGEE
jgi:hypothetical protein